jgi:hypothetical protein
MKPSHQLIWKLLLVFLLVSFAAAGLDWLSAREGMQRKELLFLDDVLTGLVSAAFVFVVSRRADERQNELERRLKVAGEMNHHIRNALQPIVYAHTLDPNQYTPMVRDSVRRIEWALNVVLEGDGEPQVRDAEPSVKIDKIHTPE